jgi:histidinol-phosphate/aromatic aminotransferase/cobyric acid decarboxylase-like protein
MLVNALSLSASAHLLGERDAIEEKIRQLIEERELIDRHLNDQQEKQREVWQLYDSLLW